MAGHRVQGVSTGVACAGRRSAAAGPLLPACRVACVLTSMETTGRTDRCSLSGRCWKERATPEFPPIQSGEWQWLKQERGSKEQAARERRGEQDEAACSSARDSGCSDALVLRRAEEAAAAILCTIAAEAGV